MTTRLLPSGLTVTALGIEPVSTVLVTDSEGGAAQARRPGVTVATESKPPSGATRAATTTHFRDDIAGL